MVGVSALAHAALLWVEVSPRPATHPAPEPPATPLVSLVELPAESAPAQATAQTDLNTFQEFHVAAVERATSVEQTLTEALQQRAEAALSHQQQLAALASEQALLDGQVETLTVEKADLAAQLASEQQRLTELEAQLQSTRQEKEQEVAGVKGAYDQLVAALKGEISQKDIALHQARRRLVVSILDRVLFPSGQATLTPEGQRVLAKVAKALNTLLDQRIVIEGHTDNMPISPTLSARFPSNWELSTARATEVVKYLLSQTQLAASRFSAVGRADTAPVAVNTTDSGRAQNRRIEIILQPLDEPSKDVS